MTEQERREFITQQEAWLEEAKARHERGKIETARVLAQLEFVRSLFERTR